MLVIAKKRLPALALILVGTSLREIPRDSGEADPESELIEFCLDLSSPPSVLIGESTNEGLYLNGNRRSPGAALRDRSSVQLESLSMPAGDGFGLNDD